VAIAKLRHTLLLQLNLGLSLFSNYLTGQELQLLQRQLLLQALGDGLQAVVGDQVIAHLEVNGFHTERYAERGRMAIPIWRGYAAHGKVAWRPTASPHRKPQIPPLDMCLPGQLRDQ
jgi:hypothetical protein